MKKIKLTFNIDEDVADMLVTRIPKRKRSTFIEEAIRLRFTSLEQERFLREVAEANIAVDRELTSIDEGLEPEDAILQSDEDLIDDDEILELDDLI